MNKVVRARLTHPGGQRLGDPKGDSHFGDPGCPVPQAGSRAVLRQFVSWHRSSVTALSSGPFAKRQVKAAPGWDPRIRLDARAHRGPAAGHRDFEDLKGVVVSDCADES